MPSVFAATARTAIVQFLLTWVLVFFFLASRTDLKRKLVAAHQGFGGKVRALHMFRDIEDRVGSYMFTMVMINAGLGVAMALAALLLGMPSPHIWGVLAALLNFVPYLGPATLTVLLGLSGIVHYEDPLVALAPMAAYAALNFIESNLVTPLLVGVRMRVTPLAVIISISLLTWLWGAVGAIIAIPLLVIFKTICDCTPVLQPVGILIGELEAQQPFQRLRGPTPAAARAS
jgi:predicted PurR-regulated permease PerM